MTIDIGSSAIDRGSFLATNNITFISVENPANLSGRITSIEIWAVLEMTGVKVATFEEVDTNTFTARDSYTIGTVAAGSKQTFDVDLDVQAGDYIGLYTTGGAIENDTSGSGTWNTSGDQTGCVGELFTFNADRTMSLYGTGAYIKSISGVFGLTGTISPSKIYHKALSGVLSFTSSLTVWIHYTWVGVSKAIGEWGAVSKVTDDCTQVSKEKGEFSKVEKE